MQPIRCLLELSASPTHCLTAVLIHLGPPLILGARDVPSVLLGSLVLVLIWSLQHELRRHALRTSRDAIVALRAHGARWTVWRRDGRCVDGCSLRSALAGPAGAWLELRLPDGRLERVAIAYDACSSGSLRRLRVQLRSVLAI